PRLCAQPATKRAPQKIINAVFILQKAPGGGTSPQWVITLKEVSTSNLRRTLTPHPTLPTNLRGARKRPPQPSPPEGRGEALPLLGACYKQATPNGVCCGSGVQSAKFHFGEIYPREGRGQLSTMTANGFGAKSEKVRFGAIPLPS